MRQFDIGETVICSVDVTREGSLYDPDTNYPKITIYDNDGNKDIDGVSMSKDDTGEYHYDYQTSGKSSGTYRAEIEGQVGARITLISGTFELR